MKGKIFTIAGIVMIFGYFISESLKNPTDPTQVILIGNDTLGQDWGAIADQKMREAADAISQNNAVDINSQAKAAENFYSGQPLINNQNDPYSRDKLNPSSYSTLEDGSGREVITDYNRTEQEDNEEDHYLSRRQKERNETEEPEIKFRD